MRAAAAKDRISDLGETEFLAWVRARAASLDSQPGIGIGDDAALIPRVASGGLLVTTDALIEDVHFRFDWISHRQLGAKSANVNLSDLAAMAARPVSMFVTLGVPPDTRVADMKEFYEGLLGPCVRWGFSLGGGDLVRAPVWMVAITMLGEPKHRRRVVRRSGAKPGDALYVTGFPGESAAGLAALRAGAGDADNAARFLVGRHLAPEPRLEEAWKLASMCDDLAMMDLSDGIWSDAHRLAEESGVGIEIEFDRLPVSAELHDRAEAAGSPPEEIALFGGEDYELLFTTGRDAELLHEIFAMKGFTRGLTRIGRVTEGRGVRLVDSEGRELKPPDATFRHFA